MDMGTGALENIIKILKDTYIHDARFKLEFLSLLNERAGDNLSALCEYTIDNLTQ